MSELVITVFSSHLTAQKWVEQ